MKKKYVAVIILLSMFLFAEAESAEDVSDAVSESQVNVKLLMDRVKVLEERFNEIQEAVQTIKSNKTTILKLISEFENVKEKYKESPIETINTLKNAVAELRKIVEDQNITMGIFGMKYNIFQKPLEPIEKSIENQIKTISKIVVRLDEQEQKIKLLGEEKQTKVKNSSTIQKELDNKEVIVQLPIAKAEIRIANFLKEGGHYDIGGGLYAKELMFEPFGTSVEFSGKIFNASERDVSVANLSIYIHDKRDLFVWDQDFRISGIKRGREKFFSEILSGIKIKQIGKYALVMGFGIKPIEFIDLRPNALSKKELKVIEEKHASKEEIFNKDIEPVQIPILTATPTATPTLIPTLTPAPTPIPTPIIFERIETIEKTSNEEQLQKAVEPTVTNITEKETMDIESDDQIEEVESEGFEDVGGGFSVSNVNIIAIDSGVKLSGILKNSSGYFHDEEQLFVKFFDKDESLVHMEHFTVFSIADKSTLEFSQVVTGITPDDFDSYKITILGK